MDNSEKTSGRNGRSMLKSGWLLWPLIPLFYFIGRGLGNSSYLLLFIGSLVALKYSMPRLPRPIWLLYILMLAAFMLSVPGAIDSGDAIKSWLSILLWSSSFFIVFMALESKQLSYDALMLWMAISGGIASIWFFLKLVHLYSIHAVIAISIKGLIPAFMMPFVLFWVSRRFSTRVAYAVGAGFVFLLVSGLLLADSNTEVLVAAATLSVYFLFSVKRRRLIVVGGMLLGLLAIVAEIVPKMDQLEGLTLIEALDVISSHRLDIWRRAFEFPPENQWIGVGLRNTPHYTAITDSGAKSIHNFILATWYETGWLGASALLVYLSYLSYAIGRWLLTRGSKENMRKASPWLASIAGILVATSIDGSAKEFSFSFFIFFSFGVLWWLMLSEDEKRMPSKSRSGTIDVTP